MKTSLEISHPLQVPPRGRIKKMKGNNRATIVNGVQPFQFETLQGISPALFLPFPPFFLLAPTPFLVSLLFSPLSPRRTHSNEAHKDLFFAPCPAVMTLSQGNNTQGAKDLMAILST